MEELVSFWGFRVEIGDDVKVVCQDTTRPWFMKRDFSLEKLVNENIRRRKEELEKQGEPQTYFLCMTDMFTLDTRPVTHFNHHSGDLVKVYLNSLLSDGETEHNFDMTIAIDPMRDLVSDFQEEVKEKAEDMGIGFEEISVSEFRKSAYFDMLVTYVDKDRGYNVKIYIPCRCKTIGRGEMTVNDIMDFCALNTIL